jgi:hypothetical protein
MANVSNFIFDNMSRINSDSCYLDQTSIQNTNQCNYILQNYFVNDCMLQNPIKLATSQPCIMYNGGYGSNSCNVDDSSKLLIGTIQTHNKAKIDLFQRPFATVPFLGRGSVCPIMESQIQQGDMGTNKRSVNKLGENSYLKYSNTPLLSNIKDRVTNDKYCVEESNGSWVRGGIPSRELTKDRETYK